MKPVRNLLSLVLLTGVGCLIQWDRHAGNKPDGSREPISCTQCHGYPGSPFCRDSSVTVDSRRYTFCASCHPGSIAPDTILDTARGDTVVADALPGTSPVDYPRTDSLHANGTLEIRTCTHCHEFPSTLCRYPSLFYDREVRIRPFAEGFTCAGCHPRSIAVTSVKRPVMNWDREAELVPGEGTTEVVLDSMFFAWNDSFAEVTGLHDNGSRDTAYNPVQFGYCTVCHEYPPPMGAHAVHIDPPEYDERETCVACHFRSIQSARTGRTDGYDRFVQRMILTSRGDTLALVDSSHHLNGTVDVFFRDNVEVRDPHFGWNREEMSCTKIDCHGEPGEELYEFSKWKQGG